MTGSRYRLVIGTKMWSSWSLRPWLLMRAFGIPFDEVTIPLRSDQTAAAIAGYSPSGKIPALIDGPLTVWDSLAMIEYVADSHPELAIWPRNTAARAVARAVSAEMHSGFQALRQNCPMDFCARDLVPTDPKAVVADVARILALWASCRAAYGDGGPFLFGSFSAADAIYAPVVSRFVTYGSVLHGHAHDEKGTDYISAVMALPALVEWGTAALIDQHKAEG
jgi:glutathione S-transferase